MKYGHHYHRRRHRRHHKHHIQRPLVTTKQYCRITCREVNTVIGLSVQGDWDASFGISWQQPRGIVNAVYGFNAPTSQFLKEYKNWEEYAIVGCRIQYIPSSSTASGISTMGHTRRLEGIWTFDDPNSYNPSGLNEGNVVNRKDSKALPVNKQWKEYKNCRAFSAVQNVAW